MKAETSILLGPASLGELKRVGNVRVSPDGGTVLYTISEVDLPENRRLTSIWAVPYSGGHPTRIVEACATLGIPEWSPDSARIAFAADRGGQVKLWVLDWRSRELREIVCAEPGTGPVMTDDFYAGLDWSPDGSAICFVAQAREGPDDAFRWIEWHHTEAYPDLNRRTHVWVLPVAGGAPLQLTHGDYHHAQPRWSPDGRFIAFVSNRSGQEEAVKFSINQNYDIWIAPSQGGEAGQLTKHPGPDVGPCWSPDGSEVAYTWTRADGSETDVFSIRAVQVQSGAARDVTNPAAFDHSIPRLEPGSWRGGRFVFAAEVRGQMQIMSVPEGGGQPVRLSPEGCSCTFPRVSASGNKIAFLHESPNQPPEVYTCEPNGGNLRRLTFTNPEIEKLSVHPAETVRWTSFDGREIEGFLIAPAGAEGPLATIVYPHGGPHSATFLNYSLDYQAYASLGYAVFLPNFRGSSGYGQAFLDADRGDFGGADFEDLMTGVDHLIAAGRADAARLFIVGGSYGGFMACWAAGHTDRFRAAIASCAITNLYSFYGQTEIPSWIEWAFGFPWENADRLRAHSPITFAHRVRTPMLLTHGQNDLRVPFAQSQEFYRVLKKLGVESDLIVYPGEGHPILKPQHAIDLLRRKIDWLARHGGISPSGEK